MDLYRDNNVSPHGRAVQVDSITPRVGSAHGFSACNWNIVNCLNQRFNVCFEFQLVPLQLGRVEWLSAMWCYRTVLPSYSGSHVVQRALNLRLLI